MKLNFILERLRNALNRGMGPAAAPIQEYDKRTSRELSEAVPQTDILGNIVLKGLTQSSSTLVHIFRVITIHSGRN